MVALLGGCVHAPPPEAVACPCAPALSIGVHSLWRQYASTFRQLQQPRTSAPTALHGWPWLRNRGPALRLAAANLRRLPTSAVIDSCVPLRSDSHTLERAYLRSGGRACWTLAAYIHRDLCRPCISATTSSGRVSLRLRISALLRPRTGTNKA